MRLRSRYFGRSKAGSFRKAEKKGLVLAISMTSVQFIKTNLIQNRLLLINTGNNELKMKKFYSGAGADPIWPQSAPGPRTSGAGAV